MTRQPTPANILDAVLTADVLPDRTALRARLRWDYSQVAPVDRRTVEEAAVDILANGQRAMESASAAGQRLIEVKRLLNHGQFGDWIETEFGMTQRMAQMWMNIARTFDGKSEIISLFSETAIALLAAPSTPEPARQEAIQEAQATGKSPSVARTKEIIAQHRPSAISNQQSPISNPQPVTVDVLPPSDAPLPSWAEDPASISRPGQSVADYLVYRDQAWAEGMAAMNIREWRQRQDELSTTEDPRLPAAQRLMALYGAVIDSEDEYGQLTGRFSDTLAMKRELTHMITHLADLIAIIQHPEEVTPAAD